MQFLKADTAATILIGPFLDKDDGVTPETGITLGAADSAEIMKHDGTTFIDISARTFTHKEKGMYTLALTANDTDTEGRMTVFISDESICLPVWAEFMVIRADIYDAIFGASQLLEKAAKSLINKAIQNKNTGVVQFYDDDGETVILTHTPTDAETTITRTPS